MCMSASMGLFYSLFNASSLFEGVSKWTKKKSTKSPSTLKKMLKVFVFPFFFCSILNAYKNLGKKTQVNTLLKYFDSCMKTCMNTANKISVNQKVLSFRKFLIVI